MSAKDSKIRRRKLILRRSLFIITLLYCLCSTRLALANGAEESFCEKRLREYNEDRLEYAKQCVLNSASQSSSCCKAIFENLKDRVRQHDILCPESLIFGPEVDTCKKDILIVLDMSYSIGKTVFNEDIKPFIKNLIKNKKLNVGVHGTHIAMIVFSSQPKTKVLLNFGDKFSQKELELLVDKDLDWEQLSDASTRTGLALKIADTQIFTANSPGNYSPKVADVVILITDGEPRGAWNEKALAYKYADSLKKKKILIIGIAAGTKSRSLRDVIKKIATSKQDTFDANFPEFDKIMAKLINASCQPFKPGCECPRNTTAVVAYVKYKDSKANVSWTVPEPTCSQTTLIFVSPDVSPGNYFSVGSHTVDYVYSTAAGFGITCSVNIEVNRYYTCGGKDYNPLYKICCQGKLQYIMESTGSWKCCGKNYYNDSYIASKDITCP